MLSGVKRILYASDLQGGSRPAFRAAVSLCGHYQSHITYLHVIESPSRQADRLAQQLMAQDPLLQDLHDDSLVAVREQILARVEDFCAAELEIDEQLQVDQLVARVEEGRAWQEILRVADEIKASVIVMGTRHGLGKKLLGSTAAKVMEHSVRPVLIVPL
ncbi:MULTISPECIES: universal stress protein [unclassified Oceanobacter]|uniref:universal stress protein n=2 Tax=Gammaproteobacteria TaxID=1236 RepID=UPI002733C442|nr:MULTISPECIES: universal stress protein [unclassified Oceanobacter]MDP2609065.1 universal stress protein [Oceanobacter sp. 1_MG-2023]MDP2612387.1 universal stress protein [Oceanobacter sp. 2_MG-2023]